LNVEKWGWYSVAVNVTLAALNLMVAMASGSLAVAAEMVHNAVDVVSALAVLVGLKLSKRKSKAFPYGLYKVENVVALAVSLLTLLTAYEIGKEALLRSAAPATVNLWVVGGASVSAVLPLLYSHFEMRAGVQANSPALKASAQDHRTHVFSSGLVIVALLAGRIGLPVDRLVALFVVILISHSAFELLLDSVRVLLDASLPAETLAEIRELIGKEPLVAEVKYVTGRNAGRYRFVEAEIVLRTENLAKSHELQTRVEERIRQTLPNVERVLIHAEPMARTHLRYAVPLVDLDGTLSEHFGEAPYFALATLRLADKQVERREIVANPYTDVPKAKGIRVAEWLVEHKVDVLVMHEDLQGKGPMYVFGEAGVEVRRTQAQTLAEAIREASPAQRV
jgi:cation diffusion facilitator family transporter